MAPSARATPKRAAASAIATVLADIAQLTRPAFGSLRLSSGCDMGETDKHDAQHHNDINP
jgi:hypothetical protein